MIEEVKKLRVQIDGLAQLVKQMNSPIVVDLATIPENFTLEEWLDNYENGLQIYRSETKPAPYIIDNKLYKSHDSLLLAKAWLGKVLEELNAENPYKSGYKTVEDIEPTADTSNLAKESQFIYGSDNAVLRDNILIQEDWNSKNHIEKVDWIREEIKNLIKSLPNNKPSSRFEAIAWTNTYNHLSEARFYLGFELSHCKEEYEKRKR